jgi:predicted permease
VSRGGVMLLTDLLQDVRVGCRSLRNTPLVATVTLVTAAVVIGANTTIFSLLNVLLLRDLPVRAPESLVQFTWQYPGDPPLNHFGAEQYERFRDNNTAFSEMFGLGPFRLDGASPAGPETLNGECVTGNFFQALGISSAAGRVLSDGDNTPGSEAVAVLSWSYWRERFNLDRGILGQRVVVAGIPATIVGVASREFSGLIVGYKPQIWIPLAVCERKAPSRLALVARLKDGVTLEAAAAEMRVLDRPRIELLAVKDPQWRKVTLNLASARTGLSTPLHDQFGKPLWVLMGIVAALLLLAGANIAGIFLARGAARQREMAIRVSLGAGRLRIVRQLMTESLLLATAGSLLGLLGAYFGADLLLRILSSGTRMIGVPPSVVVTIDGHVLLFTMTITVLVAVLFGSVPAWTAFVSAPASWLRDSGVAGIPRQRRLMAHGLVVAQVALSLALLTVSSLYVRHLGHLRNKELGFDRTSVLLVGVDAAPTGLTSPQLQTAFQELMQRFGAVPGVRSVTLSGTSPVSGGAASRFVTVDGFQEPPEARRRLMLNVVAPRYFETYRTPLVAGRDFQFGDEAGPPVAIVNEAMVRHYFADGHAVGKHIRLENDPLLYEIVGVVGDAKYLEVRSRAPQTVYVSCFQQNRTCSEFSLRTDIPPRGVASDVRRVVGDVLKEARLAKVTTLAEQVDAAIVPERLIAALSGFVGSAAALLAAVGLYGLLAFTVARRTREFGVRLALGASARDITVIVLRNALVLAVIGVIVGAPLASWATSVAATMVVNLSPEGVGPMVVACGTMIAVALLAAYVPVRRATRVDPLTALRSE